MPRKSGDDAASRLWRFLFSPVDIASLAAFRIGFGLLMARELFVYLEDGGVRQIFVEPSFHFTWLYFDWVKPWPGFGMYLHFYALLALALCVAAGLFYRVSAALFCIGFTYAFLIDQAKYLNHWYLICLLSFLMVVVPAHRTLSLDAWRRPNLRSEQAPAWALWLIRAQMGFVYVFGGIAKLNADWLQGRPMNMWLPGSIRLPGLEPVLAHPASALLVSWAGAVIDLFIVPALLWRRTRPFAFAVALAFHGINSEMFQIGVFPWLALWCTVTYFDADWPRRVFNWPRAEALSAAGPVRWDTRARSIGACVALYAAIQVLVPLRHFLYVGNVHWTEEGHRFAWHMKLRSKNGMASYRLTDPETGRTWQVDPTRELRPDQARKMASNPFMVLQYAHHLADLASRPGERRVEVRALVVTTLNGHPAEPLVDPDVDLAAIPRELFGPRHWILPQDSELSRRLRASLPPADEKTPSRSDPSVE